jgi:hypothetical protein
MIEHTTCPGEESLRVETNDVIPVQRTEGEGGFLADRGDCYARNNWTWAQRRLRRSQKVFTSEGMCAFSTDEEIAAFFSTIFEGNCHDIV